MGKTKPMAVIDAHDSSWYGLGNERMEEVKSWLRTHGVEPDDTYKVEIWRTDHLFARVYQFDANEDGKRYCPLGHDHLMSGEECDIARREPFDVPLATLPSGMS